MSPAIKRMLSQVRCKVRVIVRMKPHYSVTELIHQFLTQVRGPTEYQNGAIFHVSSSSIDRLDGVYEKFLRDVGLSEEEAVLSHNFFLPTLRENIGVLDVLHKTVLSKSDFSI